MNQDYIMRLIGQLGAMLAAIVAKRRAGLIAEAQQDLNAYSIQTVGMPLPLVRRMSPDALIQHLHGGTETPDHSRAVILAELLMQEAEILESQPQPASAVPGQLHAFCLLTDAFTHLTAEEQATYRLKINALAEKLTPLPPNPYVTAKLAQWHSRP